VKNNFLNTSEAFIAVNFQHAPNLVDILVQYRLSIVISTYQAGKVLVLGSHDGKLSISCMDYDRPMGVAISQDQMAIGAGAAIHFLRANHRAAASIKPIGSHDGTYVPHISRHTGRILVHDLGWGSEGLWVVNTLFSCLCTLDDMHSFVPRWKPPFVSQLADEDRCHLNGLAMENGRPRIVSALAHSDSAAGWRADKARTGCLIDVPTSEIISDGLCMPHSPRFRNGQLFVLNSGLGNISYVDLKTGRLEIVESVPGYTRGLAFYGPLAFVGLSRIRETNVFGGLPIDEHREDLCCGVAVIDMTNGRTISMFRFLSGVEEIFAVDVIPGFVNLAIGGTRQGDQQHDIWVVPPELPALDTEKTNLCSMAELKQKASMAHENGRLSEALQYLQQAQEQNPDSAELLNLLGNLQQDLGNSAAALSCYERAVQLQPRQSHAQRNLGVLYSARNQPHRALHHFGLAQQAEPHPMNLVLGAKLLPVIYDSKEQICYWRQRLTDCIDHLVNGGVTIDTTDSVIPTTFYFAYQGENDRPLMEKLAQVYRGIQCCDAANDGGWKPKGPRLRVGFASAYFCQHTIGRLNLGMIQRLSRDRFEVTVIALNHHADQRSNDFRRAADHYVEVPRHPARARRMIADMGLDILIFADVGMDCLSQTLCYSRMAPIQAVTWGHPDTTGSPAIDYFISSDLAEPTDAQEHYSERLIRLANMGIYYPRPEMKGARRDKASFGLDGKRRVYLCPQTLFKFHPDFDEPLRKILESDPGGDLVVIRGSNPEWAECLLNRWRPVLPDADQRVRFLPSMPRHGYLHLLSVADVILDPFPFCGGNSSYEAIAIGTPVVTLQSRFLRGRLTHGLYQNIGLTKLSVTSIDEYVQQSLEIATDEGFSAEIRHEILEMQPSLYENRVAVSAWEDCMLSLAQVV
jgi:protein O-GlcNAc transferase